MAVRCPDWMTAAQEAQIQNDLDDIAADADLSETLDYLRYDGGSAPTVDADSGTLTDPYVTTSGVPAYVGGWSAAQVTRFPSLLQASDLRALFRKSKVPGTLTVMDKVLYASVMYRVVMVRQLKNDVGLAVVALRRAGGAGA